VQPCAGLEGGRPRTFRLAPVRHRLGRRLLRLARLEGAGRAPQADGEIEVLATLVRRLNLIE
jgi:hypothetical protein